MDLELLIWIAIFVGGYLAILVALLRVALRKEGDRAQGNASDSG